MNEKRIRRQFTGEQKPAIVKRHLVDQVPVSELCEEYQILPNQFYQWQRQLFENGASAFERKKSVGAAEPMLSWTMFAIGVSGLRFG